MDTTKPLAEEAAEMRWGRDGLAMFAAGVRGVLVLGEAARVVLAQSSAAFRPAQDMLRRYMGRDELPPACWKGPAAVLLAALTDEERSELFGKYCRHCGSTDPRCQCWNDD